MGRISIIASGVLTGLAAFAFPYGRNLRLTWIVLLMGAGCVGEIAVGGGVPRADDEPDATASSGGPPRMGGSIAVPNGGPVEIFIKFYADNIARLLRNLKGSGSTPNLLRDSVVMVGTEAGHLHQGIQVPVALFGQGGGYFKTNQLLNFGRGTSNYWKHTGTLLAVCRSMGVKLNVVGNPSPEYQRGPWPALLQSG